MSPWVTSKPPTHASFPRVSGDEPSSLTVRASAFGFSPRERG